MSSCLGTKRKLSNKIQNHRKLLLLQFSLNGLVVASVGLFATIVNLEYFSGNVRTKEFGRKFLEFWVLFSLCPQLDVHVLWRR